MALAGRATGNSGGSCIHVDVYTFFSSHGFKASSNGDVDVACLKRSAKAPRPVPSIGSPIMQCSTNTSAFMHCACNISMVGSKH
uniref:Uncharacterized protein n=1 Tax=Oryza sativa subsp. japonica TaxID=39947 RepID=Q69X97_ORYSJ|nr:hypothetical protein [Oryza sativa Japonica Group]